MLMNVLHDGIIGNKREDSRFMGDGREKDGTCKEWKNGMEFVSHKLFVKRDEINNQMSEVEDDKNPWGSLFLLSLFSFCSVSVCVPGPLGAKG